MEDDVKEKLLKEFEELLNDSNLSYEEVMELLGEVDRSK